MDKATKIKSIIKASGMVDAGRKKADYMVEYKPKEVTYPSVSFSGKSADVFKGCAIGDDIQLVVKARLVGMNMGEASNRAEVEIRSIAKVDKKY